MVIRGVFIVTLLPPITTFGIKSAKYRCFCEIFGRKLRRCWAKTLLFRFNIRLFQSFFAILLATKEEKYVPTQQKIRPDVVQDTSGRNFRSVLVATKKRLLLTSSESLVSFKQASLEPARSAPKTVRYFGHSIPSVRATSARYLSSRCPSLGSWVLTWWARVDRLIGSDRMLYVLFSSNQTYQSFLLFLKGIVILCILER